MNPDHLLASFRRRFKAKIKEARIEKMEHRLRETRHMRRVWFTVGRADLKNAVRHLCKLSGHPHFSVISGCDMGDYLEMIYHFTINYASDLGETIVSIRVRVPKKDPVLQTITDLIPGALVSEREMQEMLGIKIKGIPDSRRIFLHPDFPRGVYPWRRDETGPARLVRNLHKGGKG